MLDTLPEEDDSPDLTDDEIAGAIETSDSNHFVRMLEETIRPIVGASIQKQELRRRRPHLYCRTRLAIDGEPGKVLLFRVDWLSNG
jgi:hypothetical protein